MRLLAPSATLLLALALCGCWGLEDALEERARVAEEQERFIDVAITDCGAESASGTITNRNAEATRVSFVIWFTRGGGLQMTGAADASPIGPGEVQEWTAEATGAVGPLDADMIANLECHVESIAVFPF